MSDPLSSRIASGLQTTKAWDDDRAILQTVRESIPLDKLMPEWYVNRDGGDGDDPTSHLEPALRALFPRRIFQPSVYTSTTSPYAREDDVSYEGDDLFLKRLTLYFKVDVMTWVNNPCCVICGDTNTTNCGMRGPTTNEERQGKAGRVELYKCPTCGDRQTTTFPRYNSARKLFETRKGRCGEWANLFGLYCRSVGFETRYITDFTDHVWVEVWSHLRGSWIHADACEGKIDEPSMYESGWGKNLNYIIALWNEGGGQVADVTGRYSRKMLSDEMQARRREVTPSEEMGEMIIAQINASLRTRSKLVGKTRQDELDRRISEERKFLHLAQQSGTWEGSLYNEGRISGSLAWRATRQELGDSMDAKSGDTNCTHGRNSTQEGANRLHVESFCPFPFDGNINVISISVASGSSMISSSDSIVVNGTPCAVGTTKSISIVIVDEQAGCILQSRSFTTWNSAATFLHLVPNERIVAISADAWDESSLDVPTRRKLSRLGGLDWQKISDLGSEGELDENIEVISHQVLFIGQLHHHPEWAIFKSAPSAAVLAVNVTINTLFSPEHSNLMLRVERSTAPRLVSCRLPEASMPLGTQLLANEQQKRQAFVAFMESEEANKHLYSGYTTRDGVPVYLLTPTSSFPFQRCGDTGSDWTTHHYLPEALVPEKNAKYLSEDTNSSLVPSFDIPTDVDFFGNLLGPSLLSKDSAGNVSSVETATALNNSRLIALYFSASWCGPCRKFSPMLAEFYMLLKEGALPSHGLEIIFVSSDRDSESFNLYYGKMPWLSLPFEQQSIKQSLGERYGVRGIPALIVLDAITGAVVVPADQSRSEVAIACQGGEGAITELVTERWLQSLPPESKSIMESLALSCADGNAAEGNDSEINNYLVRKLSETDNDIEEEEEASATRSQEQIKATFTDLVAKEGLAPNAAAAKAIQMFSEGQRRPKFPSLDLSAGAVNDIPWTCTIYAPADIISQADGDGWEELSRSGSVGFYKKNGSSGGAEFPLLTHQLNGGPKSDSLLQIAETAKKYLGNAKKDPYTNRFRHFKLSNKIFDRIVQVPGGLDVITSWGFAVYRTDTDFYASIPLAADLASIELSINRVLDGL